jgi:hypothetical protein
MQQAQVAELSVVVVAIAVVDFDIAFHRDVLPPGSRRVLPLSSPLRTGREVG